MNINRRAFSLSLAGALGAITFSKSFAAASDVLRIGIFKPAGNLDPHRFVGMWGVQGLLYDPLVSYGDKGEFLPGLAESFELSKDYRKVSFKLRSNVTFTDGTPWDAEALKWNLDRWIGNGRNKWLGISENFESLVIHDPLNVDLMLSKPVPGALSQLTITRPVRFLSPKSVDAEGNYKDAVGTSAWKLEVSNSNQTVLVRNDSYWGQKPDISRIELLVMPDPRSRLSALRSGQVDIIGGPYVSPLTPPEANSLKGAGVPVYTAPGNNTIVLGFNSAREILKDHRVRQAINLSIDRRTIVEKLLRGFGVPTINLFPEVIPLSGKRIDIPDRDVVRARALLNEAGWQGDGILSKDGKPLTLELVASEEAVPGSKALSEVLQGQLGESGIDIRLRSVDHATRHDDIPGGKYDLALFITRGAPYDPHASLISLFLSTYPGGTDGKIYIDPELDPLLLAAAEAEPSTQVEAHQKVYDWLAKNDAVAPLFHEARLWAHGPQVKNFNLPSMDYEIPYRGISIER